MVNASPPGCNVRQSHHVTEQGRWERAIRPIHPLTSGLMTRLEKSSWVHLDQGDDLLVAVPVGSCEQHGQHLPLVTDTIVAEALVDGLVTARADVVVAPSVAYGASGEHAGFPGTLSIGTEALTTVLVELARSADAFAGVVFVNGHGGNAEALGRAAATLEGEGRRVLTWSPAVRSGDAHAGRTETSLMLALAPARVALERSTAGNLRPIGELMPRLRQGGVKAVSPSGVLGDPAGATAEEGRRVLDELVGELVAAVRARFGAAAPP